MREGVLIIPVDEGAEPVLSFFTQSVILPPGGEPVGVDHILQIGAVGREYADIPGDSGAKTIDATVKLLTDAGALRSSIGFVGDKHSAAFRSALSAAMPGAKFSDQHGILDRMQRNRTPAEIAVFRTAPQLISIATQAACHVRQCRAEGSTGKKW
jgi:Xaa-Pro aminopeptidase